MSPPTDRLRAASRVARSARWHDAVRRRREGVGCGPMALRPNASHLLEPPASAPTRTPASRGTLGHRRPNNAALNTTRNVPNGCPRHCGRKPISTTRPRPCFTSSAAALPLQVLLAEQVAREQRRARRRVLRQRRPLEAVERREHRAAVDEHLRALRHARHHRVRRIGRHLEDRAAGEEVLARARPRRRSCTGSSSARSRSSRSGSGTPAFRRRARTRRAPARRRRPAPPA